MVKMKEKKTKAKKHVTYFSKLYPRHWSGKNNKKILNSILFPHNFIQVLYYTFYHFPPPNFSQILPIIQPTLCSFSQAHKHKMKTKNSSK